MKVLLVHNFYRIAGGEDTVVANEKKLLENHGHEVILYTRDNKEISEMGKFKKLSLFFTTIYNPKTSKEIVKIIRDKNIDIIHVHNTLNLISPAVYYAAIKYNKPVVQTIHNYRLICPGATLYRDDKICEECINGGLACSLKYRCYRESFLQTLACVVATKLHRIMGIYKKINYICLTEFNRNKLLEVENIFDPDKMFVKPNFMRQQDEKIVSGEDRKNQILFAGRLDETKGVDLLLKAYNKMLHGGYDEKPEAPELVICGSGPLENWCKEYIEKEGLRGKVTFLGKIEHDQVIRHMSESLASILPTRWYEGFPMTIAESLSLGTPIIGSDMGNVGNLIVEGVNGYKIKVDGDMVDNIIDAISRCVKTQIHVNDIYQSSYDIYVNNYTEEKNYQELMEIYSKII